MGKKPSHFMGRRSLFLYLAIGALILSGCATSTMNQARSDDLKVPVIESIKVNPSQDQTVVEIINSGSLPYTAFKLIDPPRIVLDIGGKVGGNLPLTTVVNKGNVKEILFEQVKAEPAATRMVIGLSTSLEYEAKATGNVITLTLSSKPVPSQVSGTADGASSQQAKAGKESGDPSAQPSEPRIFFQERPSGMSQVLGIDFTMLDHGRSRVMVTTDKKGAYDLDRKGQNTLILKLSGAAIPSQLLREIDSSQFAGVVERIRPAYSSSEKQVSVAIVLREMVPFHVEQKEKGITIDFGPTSIKPAEKKIVPLQLAQAQPAAPPRPVGVGAAPAAPPTEVPGIPGMGKRGYTGAPMTMDFVNADVTSILRLIGEVSNLNIIWGKDVTGNVSMRLKNVPWDQALELVLTNNNLAMRPEGNVIWVTTKGQMSQLEAEERRKRDEKQREIEEKIKREKAEEKKEEVKTAYLTVNYKDVDNIMGIIDKTVKSEEGKLTVDKQTKTIIYTDRLSKIESAKDLMKKLDLAVPQVMIEARIVEASTTFTQSLGFNWSFDQQIKNNPAIAWQGTPAWATANTAGNFLTGTNIYNPTFATNFKNFGGKTLGLVFTNLSRAGMTGSMLDVQLSLAETDGKSRTLSAPKIVTRDTVKATIQQGTKLSLPSGTDANGNKTYTLTDVSLKLTVTPQITPNSMVIMSVQVADDIPDFANATGENVPINTKSADTTMMVKSGETVVIGGIYKEIEGNNVAGIPGLSKIPLLGWLFKSQTKNTTKGELLIFLTPTVLPSI